MSCSMAGKFSTEISRSWLFRISHEARRVGALEIVGQADVHVEDGDGVLSAGGLVLDPDGWRMDLMPTLLMASWRVSAEPWTSGIISRGWGRSCFSLFLGEPRPLRG